MTVRLNAVTLRAVFPKAPDAIIAAFVTHQDVLAEVCQTRQRLAYMLANVHHETAGFTIKNLTENINYTATRMAAVWPNRFKSAADVQRKYGTAPGWQRKAFDDIYGNRMGNRPGTNDGSQFIGRGGPQVTGRDGYLQVGTRIGVDLLSVPERASDPDLQPAICAAFWKWKNLSAKADAGDFTACVKLWNGGTNGLADRQAQLARIVPILAKAESEPTVPSKPAPVPPPATPQPAPASSIWSALFTALARIFGKASS
ncbi:MAG TPA: glycosyl hydrolase [Xanthobacteraceae bacterium]|nr:glycosyl hydrolase [Xanthobacteraceae bacterium]